MLLLWVGLFLFFYTISSSRADLRHDGLDRRRKSGDREEVRWQAKPFAHVEASGKVVIDGSVGIDTLDGERARIKIVAR